MKIVMNEKGAVIARHADGDDIQPRHYSEVGPVLIGLIDDRLWSQDSRGEDRIDGSVIDVARDLAYQMTRGDVASMLAGLRIEYPQEERDTWPTKITEAQAVLAVLQRGQRLLQGGACGVVRTAVLIAFMVARRGLHVGAGLENGRHDGTGGGIGLHAGMDGLGRELHGKGRNWAAKVGGHLKHNNLPAQNTRARTILKHVHVNSLTVVQDNAVAIKYFPLNDPFPRRVKHLKYGGSICMYRDGPLVL